MTATASPRILFLTTQPPSEIRAEWPYYQNWTLPASLRKRGAQVSLECWRDDPVTAETLSKYDVISFLWCNNYHNHPVEFPAFIQRRLRPALKLRPQLKIINDVNTIEWNLDKAQYLINLEKAGFLISNFETLHHPDKFETVQELISSIIKLSTKIPGGGPLVLKPSFSGSAKQTYLLQTLSNPTQTDKNFITTLLQEGIHGSLLIQSYEPAIQKGEYSLIFIAGKHTHTILKTPATREFRCQAEYGGDTTELSIDQVPAQAIKVAERIMAYLDSSVGRTTYCRIDGVIRDSGEFVLMEVEAIEPHLWLETCKDESIRDRLHVAMMEHT